MTEKICNEYKRSEEEEKQMGQKTAGRFNEGKVRYDLIAPYPLEQLAKVYTYGTIKYDDDNWWKGLKWRKEVFGCVTRHIYKWLRGEKVDDESGLHHLAHACWNLFTLISYEKNNIGTDDRCPYTQDLLPEEERIRKTKAWRGLADEGKENSYNGLDFLSKDDMNI